MLVDVTRDKVPSTKPVLGLEFITAFRLRPLLPFAYSMRMRMAGRSLADECTQRHKPEKVAGTRVPVFSALIPDTVSFL